MDRGSDSVEFKQKAGFFASINRSFRLSVRSSSAGRIDNSMNKPALGAGSKVEDRQNKSIDAEIDPSLIYRQKNIRGNATDAAKPQRYHSLGSAGVQNLTYPLLDNHFRRCNSVNLNRRTIVKIPEIPLGTGLLRKIRSNGLDTVAGSGDTTSQLLRPLSNEIAAPRIDSYRFSMANLEDSQDVDLDAILGELCALETRYQEEIGRASSIYNTNNNQRPYQRSDRQFINNSASGIPHVRTQTHNCNDGVSSVLQPAPHRTDSPDNDSAFSDTVSLLSSESSASSGASAGNKNQGLQLNLHPLKDMASQLKTEKIRLALEKMKEASIKKLFIKAFSIDGSSKSLLVDEKMTCGYVARLLADKNHMGMEPKWAIVEYLPDLHMERIYEDHELLVDNLMLWTRDSKNKIIFSERLDKISLFQTPEKFLLSGNEKGPSTDYDEHSRAVIMDEFFNQTLTSEMASDLSAGSIPTVSNMSGNPVPSLEGPLYLKSDSKKGWKRYHCIMRPSGIYYYPKEKTKSAKELMCLATFDVNEIYLGLNWKKKYKAPTDHCFAIKHPKLQQPKSIKFIKFLCAEDHETLEKWIVAMRIAKHGRQLLENYRCLIDDLAQEDLDQLAHARSCSVASISHNSGNITPQQPSHSPDNGIQAQPLYEESITGSSDTSSGRHSCVSSSSSSGCMSDGPSGSEGNAFDSEFPMGTIKRKPSMKPNIPLTSMTRQLKEMVDMAALGSSQSSINSGSDHSSNGSLNTSGYTNTGTLTRRHSRRKSNQSNNTDESSNSGTLKKLTHKTSRTSLESASSLRSSNSGCSTPTMTTPLREFIYNTIPTTGVKVISVDSDSPHNNSSTSSANIYKSHTGEVLPSSGILLGYITNQTILNNAHPQYFKDNAWYDNVTCSDNSPMENKMELKREGNPQQSVPQRFDELFMQNENNMLHKNIMETDQSRPKDFIVCSQNLCRMDNTTFSPTSVDIQDMPLPPPPQTLLCNGSSNGQFDLDEMKNQNMDPLYWSTLSLDSLPPPPPTLDDHMTLEGYDLSGSQLSLISLPPPPLPIAHDYTSSSDHPVTIRSDNDRDYKIPHSRASVSEIVNQLSSTLATQQISNKCVKDKTFVPPPTYISLPSYGAQETIKNISKQFGAKDVCGKPPTNGQQIVYGSTNLRQNCPTDMFPRQSSINSLSSTSSNNNQNNSLTGPRVNSDEKNNIYTCSVLPSVHSNENQINLSHNIINSGIYASCLAEMQLKTQDAGPVTLKKLHRSNSQHSDGTLNSYAKSVSFADTATYQLDNESPLLLGKQSFTDTKSGPCSPNKKHKKLTFSLSVDSECSESPPNLPNKPSPPKRNETTKLSSPKKLSDSTSNPPKDFLKDLQRVMRKKWQVAQKCKLEPTTTPHEVLGFREFPILTEDYKEANVSNWVQEHYGRSGAIVPPPDNLYENINKNDKSPKSIGNSDDLQNIVDLQKGAEGRVSMMKKRPPPPPPKRSESTQLTTLPNQKLR